MPHKTDLNIGRIHRNLCSYCGKPVDVNGSPQTGYRSASHVLLENRDDLRAGDSCPNSGEYISEEVLQSLAAAAA